MPHPPSDRGRFRPAPDLNSVASQVWQFVQMLFWCIGSGTEHSAPALLHLYVQDIVAKRGSWLYIQKSLVLSRVLLMLQQFILSAVVLFSRESIHPNHKEKFFLPLVLSGSADYLFLLSRTFV